MLGIILADMAGTPGFHIPLSAAVIVACITAGACLDSYFERKFHRRLSNRLADKQRTEFAILRHLSHSINPTVQMALSPLRSIGGHLRDRQQLDEVLALRRDGSAETVGAALDTAVVSLNQIREIIETTEDIFGNRITPDDFTEVSLPELFEQEILPLFQSSRFRILLQIDHAGRVRLHRPSFVQAIKNIIRNADVHGFPDGFTGSGDPHVRFTVSGTVKELNIDCENNGVPFPRGMKTKDFLTFGVKGKQSPGKGLGGAWVEKFVEVHGGRFRKISSNPVHFRITLPQRRS
jgi:K+-sensing histidine kinase KdpD